MLNFENKSLRLIMLLLEHDEAISLASLCDYLSINKRSVYYVINKTNDVLIANRLLPLQYHRGIGYTIPETLKLDLKAFLFNAQKEGYFMSPEERMYFLICFVMYPRTKIHIEDMMLLTNASRNTVFNDLKNVKCELEKYELAFVFDIKKGYVINGSAFHKRSVLLYYIKLLLKKIDYTNLSFLDLKEVQEYQSRLFLISGKMNDVYERENLISIACLLSLIRYLPERYEFSILEMKDICATEELNLIDMYFQDFNVHERFYLAIHLLGSKVGNRFAIEDDEDDIRVFELSSKLVELFGRMTSITFKDKEDLIHAIFMHLKLSMYYARLSIQVVNPLIEDIKRNYKDLYTLTQKVCEDLKNLFRIPIIDSEIACLTMHFGGHMRRNENFYNIVRILIVCPNGVSTSTLLKREIEDLYSNAQIVATIRADQIADYEGMVDFIVSTIKIDSIMPVLKVNSILSQGDKSRIASMMMLNFGKYGIKEDQLGTLFHLISQYVDQDHMKLLKKDVLQYLNNGHTLVTASERESITLVDSLDPSFITMIEEVMNWQQAIHLACLPLLEKQLIQHSYIDEMIRLLDAYGPYILLSNKVAIAHAKPENGVFHLGISLLCAKQSIMFAKHAPVQLLFVLAAPNHEDHLNILNGIMKLSRSVEMIERLMKAKNEQELYQILERLFK